MKAAHHPKEAARLAALRRYDILDTPRESDFDDIVTLASRICGTPISVINLIDAERQWFKAETGLGVRETPLETSLCAHVILEDAFVEIRDTLVDSRMCDNPLCLADPGLRFYAGALLRSPDDYPIGTLCVLDYEPRTLDDFQKEALHTLAAQVVAQLDLRAIIAREATLRREIDHRVKNSLQSVSAFVALERSAAQGQEARGVLQTVAQQIGSVAVLHEFLAESSDIEAIELSAYLARVVALIDAATPVNIRVTGVFAQCAMPAKTASVLGTIVNELVANAVKHSQGAGPISLTGAVIDGEGYRLFCRDDGKPGPPKPDHDQRRGLGLAIIAASVQQLNGTVANPVDGSGYCTQIDVPIA